MGSSGVEPLLIPKPVYVRDLFDGKVTIIVFGAPDNWNYSGEDRADMEAKNPGITAKIEEVMREYDIRRALIPKPAFNAKVVTDADLPIELLPNFFRGVDADGVILERSGDAYFLASADCLCTVLFDDQTNSLAALHCGRDAVLDRRKIDGREGESRKNESVIDAAIACLDKKTELKWWLEVASSQEYSDYENSSADLSHDCVKGFLAAGIRADTFDHPINDEKYGTANKRMIDHLIELQSKCGHLPPIVIDVEAGKIDLFALVRHQLNTQGITQIEEDEFDTATSKGSDGEFLFHSNRRDKVKRNLVIIKLN